MSNKQDTAKNCKEKNRNNYSTKFHGRVQIKRCQRTGEKKWKKRKKKVAISVMFAAIQETRRNSLEEFRLILTPLQPKPKKSENEETIKENRKKRKHPSFQVIIHGRLAVIQIFFVYFLFHCFWDCFFRFANFLLTCFVTLFKLSHYLFIFSVARNYRNIVIYI